MMRVVVVWMPEAQEIQQVGNLRGILVLFSQPFIGKILKDYLSLLRLSEVEE